MANLSKLSGVFVLLAVIAITFTACGDNGDPTSPPGSSHTHQWGEWTETTPPDCITAGEETRICDLDASHVETRTGAAALGHDWNMLSGTATCTEAGEGTAKCNRCGEEINNNVIPALGHDWGDWTETTPPDCLTDGEETKVCTRDPLHTETRPVVALGHDWGEWTETTPPDCLTDGEETKVCTRDPLHTDTRPVVALGHDWGAWTVTTPPGCTTTGIETRTCNNDALHTEQRTAPVLGHDWGEWEVTTPPDCTTPGEEERVCNRDASHTETRPIAALGQHTPFEGYCLICGEFLNSYNIGDTGPGGGKIFFIDETGIPLVGTDKTIHYLEAAPADIQELVLWIDPELSEKNEITGTGTEIGTGWNNTSLITAKTILTSAALSCEDYSNIGKNDWFLPSKDELSELHKQKNLFSNWGTTFYLPENEFAIAYWSSSEDDDSSAFALFFTPGLGFSDGEWEDIGKNAKCSVRPIRAF